MLFGSYSSRMFLASRHRDYSSEHEIEEKHLAVCIK